MTRLALWLTEGSTVILVAGLGVVALALIFALERRRGSTAPGQARRTKGSWVLFILGAGCLAFAVGRVAPGGLETLLLLVALYTLGGVMLWFLDRPRL